MRNVMKMLIQLHKGKARAFERAHLGGIHNVRLATLVVDDLQQLSVVILDLGLLLLARGGHVQAGCVGVTLAALLQLGDVPLHGQAVAQGGDHLADRLQLRGQKLNGVQRGAGLDEGDAEVLAPSWWVPVAPEVGCADALAGGEAVLAIDDVVVAGT